MSTSRTSGSEALPEIRAIMERDVGVVRDEAGLRSAVRRLHRLADAGCEDALTGLMIAMSALSREESLGAHWRSDVTGRGPRRHTLKSLPAILDAAGHIAAAEVMACPDV